MKYVLRTLLIATLAWVGTCAAADDAETLAKLDEALTRAAVFQQGQDAAPR